jgi:hypothetical protein
MAELNETIHQPVRLRIMAALAALEASGEVTFGYLRDLLEFTSGNLGAHLRKLKRPAILPLTRLPSSASRAPSSPPPKGGGRPFRNT